MTQPMPDKISAKDAINASGGVKLFGESKDDKLIKMPEYVLDAINNFREASTVAEQVHAVTNGVMSIAGIFPPWGTLTSVVWGLADIGYGDKIFK